MVKRKEGEDELWGKALAKVSKCVVQVRSLSARVIEAQSNSGIATGFVVDKNRGLILTNKHVVQVSPSRFEIVFTNGEAVKAEQFYIDPVHDFGFLRFDAKAVQFMEFDELTLDPNGARRDVQVRVVGSDAGEKLMVLRGTISRIDRNTPDCKCIVLD